jgi:hypothetical protein
MPQSLRIARGWISASVLVTAAVLALTPAGVRAQGDTRFVAPTDATVITHIEEGFGSTPSQVIWIQNNSTVPIQVYSVTLRNCQNVRQDCSPTPMNLRVRPGSREILKRVEPRNTEAGFSYRYSFGWRADSTDIAALRALADNGVTRAQQQLAANAQAAAEQRNTVGSHDVDLGRAELDALGAQIARLRAVPDSVVMHVGQLLPIHQVHILALDAQGQILGRVRAYNWRVLRNVISLQADTVVADRVGRTTAEFRLVPPAAPVSVSFPIVVVADTTP